MRRFIRNFYSLINRTVIIGIIAIGGVRYACAEDYGATARGMFAMLPASIFEITPEGLSEADKQELLMTGKSEFWEIAGETPDVMVFSTLPFRDKAIGLRVFRNIKDGSTEVAIGTLGEDVCSVELWRLDISGRLVPIDTPQEPDINDFFERKRKISKSIHHSVLICLGSGGLSAKPIFWNKTGMLSAKLDNEINFQWNGHGFEKIVTPISGHNAR